MLRSSAPGLSSSPCWFVGAMINRGNDQTDRFIDEGIWEHDFDDNSRVLAQLTRCDFIPWIEEDESNKSLGCLEDRSQCVFRCWGYLILSCWRRDPGCELGAGCSRFPDDK